MFLPRGAILSLASCVTYLVSHVLSHLQAQTNGRPLILNPIPLQGVPTNTQQIYLDISSAFPWMSIPPSGTLPKIGRPFLRIKTVLSKNQQLQPRHFLASTSRNKSSSKVFTTMNSESTQTNDPQFASFSKWPREIRLKTWEHTAQQPRIVCNPSRSSSLA